MSFPSYANYKSTQSEWLKAIPEHWSTLPVRAVVQERNTRNDNYKSVNYLSLMANIGIIPYEEKGDVGNKKPEDLSKCKMVFPGDFVINSMNYYIGSYGVSPYEGVCSPVYVVLTPKTEIAESRFSFRLFEMKAFQEHAQSFGNGILEHRRSINWDILKGILVPIPSLGEQQTIASFLDHETTKIDALIAEQQRLIELLKEKRQAVISHAVTKGLNPHVRMKDSGVEWLGEVPEHWEIKRGRYLYRERQISPEATDGVVTAFRDGQVTLRTNRRTEGFTFAVLEVGYQRVFEGDLVIHGMDAFAGAIGISESTGKCTSEYSVLVPVSQSFENAYFAKAIRLMALRNYIFVICPAVRERAPRFRFSSFKDVLLPVPPLNEQIEIVRHIEKELKEVHILEQEVDKAIKLLQERRTALISAAVTGQIDVRGFQPVAA
jgi:type I restriction enzyme S subunit